MASASTSGFALNFQALASRMRLALFGCLLLASLTGCGLFSKSSPTAFVPMQATAAEQLRYAEEYKANRNLPLIPSDQDKRYDTTREIVRQHYEKVVEYFPGDRFDTPLAKLNLLEMQAGLDAQRVKIKDRVARDSVEDFRKLAEEYPEMEFIQAKSMYDQGLCYQRIGDFENSGICYHNVWKQFENSNNDQIKNLSERARLLYNKTQIIE